MPKAIGVVVRVQINELVDAIRIRRAEPAQFLTRNRMSDENGASNSKSIQNPDVVAGSRRYVTAVHRFARQPVPAPRDADDVVEVCPLECEVVLNVCRVAEASEQNQRFPGTAPVEDLNPNIRADRNEPRAVRRGIWTTRRTSSASNRGDPLACAACAEEGKQKGQTCNTHRLSLVREPKKPVNTTYLEHRYASTLSLPSLLVATPARA